MANFYFIICSLSILQVEGRLPVPSASFFVCPIRIFFFFHENSVCLYKVIEILCNYSVANACKKVFQVFTHKKAAAVCV